MYNKEARLFNKNTMDRRVTRVAITQALYQIELMEEEDIKKVIDEFIEGRESLVEFDIIKDDIPSDEHQASDKHNKKDIDEIKINRTMFEKILNGVMINIKEIDERIVEFLAENWAYERVERVLKSILRAGVYELLYLQTPRKVVFNEYVEVAKCFYQTTKEVSFVNGILHKISEKYLKETPEKNIKTVPDENN